MIRALVYGTDTTIALKKVECHQLQLQSIVLISSTMPLLFFANAYTWTNRYLNHLDLRHKKSTINFLCYQHQHHTESAAIVVKKQDWNLILVVGSLIQESERDRSFHLKNNFFPFWVWDWSEDRVSMIRFSYFLEFFS